MRISDWSSDVCSSDLGAHAIPTQRGQHTMGIDAICLNFSGNLATNVVVVGQEIIKDSYDGCTCVSGSTQWHRYRNGRSIRPFKPASIILKIDSPIGLTIEATYQPAVEKDIERRVGGFSRHLVYGLDVALIFAARLYHEFKIKRS